MAGNYNGMGRSIENDYSLKYNQKINDKFDFLIFGGYDELEFKGETGRNLDTHYLASQYFIKPQVKYNYKENSYIIIGGDYKDGKSEDKLIPSNKDKKRESYAGYILNKTTVGDWQFTQGYRREKIKYDTEIKEGYGKPILGTKESHNADSFELGVDYLYSDTGSIYLSYVNGFRSPSIQDMGAWKGNIKLQSTENYEFGIKIYKNTYASASVFLINTKDEIYLEKTIDDTFGTNKNFDGEVRRIGTQASLQHYFDKLTLRENITYIQPKVTSGKYDGKEFAGISRWNINLGATYNFTEKLIGNIDMYYLSSAYAQDDFANKLRKRKCLYNCRYKFNL